MKVIPNPNTGEFELTLHSSPEGIGIVKVEILKMDGKKIYEKEYAGQIKYTKINLGKRVPGIYLYKLTDTSGKKYIGKLMIK